MDIRVYYQKIRQTESNIASDHVVVVSLETPDGGRRGIKTEVSRQLAAKLVVEDRARLATESETAEYHAELAELRRQAEEAEASSRVHVTLVSDADLKSLKSAPKGNRQ
jgi:hypothetical protein